MDGTCFNISWNSCNLLQNNSGEGDRYCWNSKQNDKANELMSSYNGCFSVASSNPATIPEKDLHTTPWSHGLRQDSHTERCTAISRVPWPLDFFPKQCYGLSCSANFVDAWVISWDHWNIQAGPSCIVCKHFLVIFLIVPSFTVRTVQDRQMIVWGNYSEKRLVDPTRGNLLSQWSTAFSTFLWNGQMKLFFDSYPAQPGLCQIWWKIRENWWKWLKMASWWMCMRKI